MTTHRLFKVTLTDSKMTHGNPVPLVLPRTEAQIESLRTRYEKVDAKPIGPAEAEPKLDNFHQALMALIRLYKGAEAKGDHGLAKRAEEAVAALLGDQKHLKRDGEAPVDEAPPEPKRHHTLRGIGRTDRVR
jgi:hypothetical protein